MPRPERGATPGGFRDQLLARLRNEATLRGVSAQRLQHRLAFERMLARLAPTGDWLLKGGFAMELRYGLINRSTRDIDLRTVYEADAALAQLRLALAAPHGADQFSFEILSVEGLSELPGAPLRLRISARLAGVELAGFTSTSQRRIR